MKPNKYDLSRRGNGYVIYRMEYTNGVGTGSSVFKTNDYEEARKKLYELHGWKYKPKNNEQQTHTTTEETE